MAGENLNGREKGGKQVYKVHGDGLFVFFNRNVRLGNCKGSRDLSNRESGSVYL